MTIHRGASIEPGGAGLGRSPLTGNNPHAVTARATRVGINDVRAGLLP